MPKQLAVYFGEAVWLVAPGEVLRIEAEQLEELSARVRISAGLHEFMTLWLSEIGPATPSMRLRLVDVRVEIEGAEEAPEVQDG